MTLVTLSCFFPLISAIVIATSVLVTRAPIDIATFTIADFTYHMEIFSAFWETPRRDYYSLPVQQELMMKLFHATEEETYAMPVGWTPHSFILFAPFVAFERISPVLSYFVWTVLSAGSLTYALLNWLPKREVGRRDLIWLLTLFTIVALSSVWVIAVGLGQLSTIICAIYLLLGAAGVRRGSQLVDVLIMGFLCLKPTYFLPGSILFLRAKGWPAAIRSVAYVGVLSALVLSIMGGEAWISYGQQLLRYSSPTIPSPYRSTLDYASMTNVQVLDLNVGSWILSAGRTAFYLLILAAVYPLTTKRYEIGFLSALAAVLLFSPYLGRYEDLLILTPAALFFGLRDWGSRNESIREPLISLFVVTMVFLTLTNFGDPRLNLLGKVALLGAYLLTLLRRSASLVDNN